MEDRVSVLEEKVERLLKEAAEAAVELDRVSGAIAGVPHYSVIEARAHELGEQLSRHVQQRQMAETVAGHARKARCPTCGAGCELIAHSREATSIDGPVELIELRGDCPFCRRAFFPSAGANGV